MKRSIVDIVVWMRVPGVTVFSISAVSLARFVLRPWVAPSREGVLADMTSAER